MGEWTKRPADPLHFRLQNSASFPLHNSVVPRHARDAPRDAPPSSSLRRSIEAAIPRRVAASGSEADLAAAVQHGEAAWTWLRSAALTTAVVMAGLVPAIHVFRLVLSKPWMPGTEATAVWFGFFVPRDWRISVIAAPLVVMAGLRAGHPRLPAADRKAWVAGTSPATTTERG